MESNHLGNYLADKSEKTSEHIRSFLFKNYIKTVVERDFNQEGERRWAFIANRFKSDFNNPISFECNGAVWAYSNVTNKFRPLVVPLPMFNSQKLSHQQIQKYMDAGEYVAHEVHDGTVINMYFFNGAWRISTAKAYDATDLIFCDNKTYKQVFTEVMDNVDPKWSTDKLDTGVCYTFCIRYPAFHQFTEGCKQSEFKCTLLQSVNLNMLKEVNVDVGVKRGKTIKVRNLNSVVRQLNQSVSTYKTTKKPLYGYILRGKRALGAYRCILFESTLMAKIRKFLYNMQFMKDLSYTDVLNKESTVDKQCYQLQDINSLKMFLQRNNISLYLNLFPQQKSKIDKYHEWLVFLAKYMHKNISVLTKSDPASVINGSVTLQMSAVSDYEYTNTERLNKVCAFIWSDIKDKKIASTLTGNKEGFDILFDFLHQPKWVDVYYSYLFK